MYMSRFLCSTTYFINIFIIIVLSFAKKFGVYPKFYYLCTAFLTRILL